MNFNIEVFRKICPVSESVGEKAVYGTDSSGITGTALAVAWPTDYEQLKSLVRAASREDIPITARGGGTSLVGGAVPNRAIVVDMSRMNKVRKLFVGERKVVVQAGVVLDKLNESLAEFNLEFPVSPRSHSVCTIGGMIATNAGGLHPSKDRFMKEWIEDVTFIDGTSKVYTLDKNEMRRFVGSEGCCGIIIEATLKLVSKRHYSTDLFKFSDLAGVMTKAKELQEYKDIVAIEYINGPASEIARLGRKEHLLVKYSSNRGAIDPAEADELWKAYDNIYSTIAAAGYPRIEDPAFEANIDKFLDWINKHNIPCHGNILGGSVHPHLRNADEVDQISAIVGEIKGRMVGEFGVGMLRKRFAPLGTAQNIKELKEKYDPKNILNKGKVI